MEENEALLEEDDHNRRLKSTLKTYSYEKNNFCDSPNSSASEESVSWWAEESHSSCNTSCSGPDSVYSADWKYEIDANGELFYIESEHFEEINKDSLKSQSSEPFKEDALNRKTGNSRKGKLKNWIKRKRAKRRRPKLLAEEEKSVPEPVSAENKRKTMEPSECPGDNDKNNEAVAASASSAASETFNEKFKEIVVRLNGFLKGVDLIEKTLGLKTFYLSESERFFITGFTGGGPLKDFKDINIGDVLLCVNRERLSSQNVHRLLETLKFPVEVILTIEKNFKLNSGGGKIKLQSALVQKLLEKSEDVEKALKNQAVGVVFVPLKSEHTNQKELIYSFPTESVIGRSLGSFVTLFHLSPELALKNECYSSSAYFKNGELAHVYYIPEDDHLLLIALPGSRWTKHESSYIVADLIRCLLFSHRTLSRCFKYNSNSNLNHFFSVFFSRILTSGFSANTERDISLEKVYATSSEEKLVAPAQFEDLLEYAGCLPLPKEVQIQLDDSLNELEANCDSEDDEDFEIDEDDGSDEYEEYGGDSGDDFMIRDEEGKRTKMDKGYVVIGSCLYHKGYLLASHFSREDLSSVHSFFRQNGLIHLFRNEPVKSLVVWREVHPKSAYRESLNNEFSLPTNSSKRWFLLIIGHGYDAIAFILELHGYSGKFKKHLHSMIGFIEDAEKKLRLVKKWGISQLATHWLTDKAQSKIITVDEYFCSKKSGKKMGTAVVDIIKSADELDKSLGSESPSLIELKQSAMENGFVSLKNRKISYVENSEDSTSQAPSNQSEISDENAPILGRRAERNSMLIDHLASDESENSDSDWESFQDFAQQEYTSGIFPDPRELRNQLSTRSRLTTGGENSLFHFVHFNECDGILVAPTVRETSNNMKEIIENFSRGAQLIHSLLDNNVRFKKSNEDGSKSYINKSLVAVKEHGLLLVGANSETDSPSKKHNLIHYWVIGRLFFTPHRREVYVCHCDGASQNLVEIGFRLGLTLAE